MNASPARLSWTAAFCLVLVAVAAGCGRVQQATAAQPKSNTLTPEEIASGWILLFDGETTFGWKPTSEADWKVSGGVISASQGEKGLLCTTSQFANYVLRVDFRAAEGTNSGVFLRTSPSPTDVTSKCYELNIADPGTSDWPTGSFVKRQKSDVTKTGTDWRTFEVSANGAEFTVKLDGKQVLSYTDPKPIGRGFIGLQFNSGKIEFRNIKLKPLGLKKIFNGKDLSGWKTYPEMKSKFTVTPEGWMHVKDGRGQIETEGRYADFTMQLDVFVGGKALNSGVFFRCIPGDVMNGYECQIQNGFKEGDRTKPQDCGTGGIFRRQNARRVVSDDFRWFTMTLHADGPHMAAWVNGYQVSDWTDTRKPNENPRKGKRLAAGTIQLQGHDPTTDLSFRNIRITEMPKR
jgi:hypothetical protein